MTDRPEIGLENFYCPTAKITGERSISCLALLIARESASASVTVVMLVSEAPPTSVEQRRTRYFAK